MLQLNHTQSNSSHKLGLNWIEYFSYLDSDGLNFKIVFPKMEQKQMAEKKAVEMELSQLLEVTLRLEDELNKIRFADD